MRAAPARELSTSLQGLQRSELQGDCELEEALQAVELPGQTQLVLSGGNAFILPNRRQATMFKALNQAAEAAAEAEEDA